jgi:hypothetical protein
MKKETINKTSNKTATAKHPKTCRICGSTRLVKEGEFAHMMNPLHPQYEYYIYTVCRPCFDLLGLMKYVHPQDRMRELKKLVKRIRKNQGGKDK